MRVKLQLVMCNDQDDEETVTDVITLNKRQQRIEHLGLTLAECFTTRHFSNAEVFSLNILNL